MFVLTTAAWWIWSLELAETHTRLARTVDMLREHALRTFETQDALLIAAQGYTATMSWDEIAKSRAVAGFLRELDESTPDLSAIGIVAPSGRLELRIMAVITGAMMASLLGLTWVVARRANREEDALERARVEAELRAQAESALRRGQRLEILGQIVAGVAHDFRNVAQAVLGGLDLVRRALDNGDLGRASIVIDLVAESAERGAGLTERMLRVVRVPRAEPNGPAEPRAETSDPVASVRAAAELLAPTIGRNCIIRIHTEAADVPRRVQGDPAELEAALLNLMLNARDAMPEGGEILITLAAEDLATKGLPNSEGLRPGRYARITLSDTGVGMDAETLARAADPFFTTKSEEGGTGLGLSTARTFARASGGALRVASAGPGHGTTVTLWLPEARTVRQVASDQ
jgi:signal transduction histidine kinase